MVTKRLVFDTACGEQVEVSVDVPTTQKITGVTISRPKGKVIKETDRWIITEYDDGFIVKSKGFEDDEYHFLAGSIGWISYRCGETEGGIDGLGNNFSFSAVGEE